MTLTLSSIEAAMPFTVPVGIAVPGQADPELAHRRGLPRTGGLQRRNCSSNLLLARQ